MAGLLSSIAATIDPLQITIRPPTSTASASSSSSGTSSSDDFESALARARKSDSTEQPGLPANDKSTTTRKSEKSSKKKSSRKSSSHAKKLDSNKATPAANIKAANSAKPKADSPEDAPQAKEADAKSSTDADAKQSSDQNAAEQIAARNAANASRSIAGGSLVSQSAPSTQPSAPKIAATNSTATPSAIRPVLNANTAPKPLTPTSADTGKPKTDSTAASSSDDASNDSQAGGSPDDASVIATGAVAESKPLPASTTGLKPSTPGAKGSTTAEQSGDATTDQSTALTTLAALSESDPSDGSNDAAGPAPTSISGVDPIGVAAAGQLLGNPAASPAGPSPVSGKAASVSSLPTRQLFVAANQPGIVKAVKTELLPTGGTMHMRLDPPELGVLQVSVHVKDGVVNASFETSNDDATKLLSRSLGELKTALEAQGVSIGKIHVQQTPKDQSATNNDPKGNSDASKQSTEGSSSRQDEQRRETLKRMWERLANGGDPLDLVA